jgi:outer membrane protein assembly factor BamB
MTVPLTIYLIATVLRGADQPQWGQAGSRNMVSNERGLVDSFDPAAGGAGRNVKWVANLGTQSFATPVVAGGRVYIGCNNDEPRDPKQPADCGVLLCLDAKEGSLVWQLLCPKLEEDRFYDWPHTGWCSSPTVEGDRLYVMSNRAEVMCLDAKGMADGNDGPYLDEARHMAVKGHPPIEVGKNDGDLLWVTDLVNDPAVGMWPHDGAHASILVDGDCLYVNTCNGVDNTHRKIRRPDAPSLVVLDKRTGRVVARDGERIGPRVFHSTWSSPSMGEVGGKRLVFFCGGDGVVYAFEALKKMPEKGAVETLKKVWWFDCDPTGPKEEVAKFMQNRRVSPSNIYGMPVFVDGRIYVAGGGDIFWGKREAWMKCIDASGTGDVTKTNEVWSYPLEAHCIGTPAVHEGLVYIADVGRNLHCVEAASGKGVWTQKLGAETWASPLVADGRVWVATRSAKGDLWALAAGREKKVLGTWDLGGPVAGTVTAADGVIYVATMTRLFAMGAR